MFTALLHHFICKILPQLTSRVSVIAVAKLPLTTVDCSEVDDPVGIMEDGELRLWPRDDTIPQGDEHGEEAKENETVLMCLRVLAWFFSAMMRARYGSEADYFSPPFAIAPLQLRGETNDGDSDSEDNPIGH